MPAEAFSFFSQGGRGGSGSGTVSNSNGKYKVKVHLISCDVHRLSAAVLYLLNPGGAHHMKAACSRCGSGLPMLPLPAEASSRTRPRAPLNRRFRSCGLAGGPWRWRAHLVRPTATPGSGLPLARETQCSPRVSPVPVSQPCPRLKPGPGPVAPGKRWSREVLGGGGDSVWDAGSARGAARNDKDPSRF
jgi:hypothetical protein